MADQLQIDRDRLYERIKEAEVFTKHFGSFTKTDYEVLMFTVFLDSMDEKVRDYDISVALGITESKVRTLRVKSQLFYPRELKWIEQLTEALENGYYEDGVITITLEDPSVRNKIRDEVEKQCGTVNLSLNSKQLVLPLESYLILAACAEPNAEDVLKKLNEQFNKNEEVKGKIQKEKFRARIFNRGVDLVRFLPILLTIYTEGRPIVEAIIKLITKQ